MDARARRPTAAQVRGQRPEADARQVTYAARHAGGSLGGALRLIDDGVFELKKDFQVELDQKQSNQASAVLVLTPKTEDPNIQNLRLQIDLQSFQLMSLETRDALGNTNRITLESQKEKPSLDGSLFRLDIPPDTAVLDADGREIGPAQIQKLKDQTK